MTQRAKLAAYILGIATAASVLAGWLYLTAPEFHESHLQAALSFGLISAVSQIFTYHRPVRGASGSAAFLPFMTALVLAPNWVGVATVAGAVLFAELVVRRAPLKALFNVSQLALAASVTTVVFVGLGGRSALTGFNGLLLPMVVALPTFLVVNTLALAGVIAIDSRRRFREVLLALGSHSVVYDVLAFPFVYVFAWFYNGIGPLSAVVIAIPLLGLRELYKTNAQLKQANQELLELMVAAIEARDPYTSGHSRRVAANSRLIAEFLGLSRKQVERIFVAGLLHDVGKIHEVYGPILSKPGRLTPAEHDIMKTHSAKGAELIQNVSQLRDIIPVVRHHHENWDGSGYPDGIAGESVPLGSRIIMFADTIDAMMSDRPYRPALTPLQVRAELVRFRAKQFDPSICDALLGSHVWDELFANAPTPVRTGEHPQLLAGPTRVTA